MRLTALALVALLVVGCGGDSGPSSIEVTGAWAGPVTFASGGGGTLSFTVTETSGTVKRLGHAHQ